MAQNNNELYVAHVVDQFFHSPDFVAKVSDVNVLRAFIKEELLKAYSSIEKNPISDRMMAILVESTLRKIAEISDGIARQAQVALLNDSPNGQIVWSVYKGITSVLSQRAYNAIVDIGKIKFGPLKEVTKYWARDEQGNLNPTLAQVSLLSPSEILGIPGAGLATLNAIRRLLFSKGLTLRGDTKKIVYKSDGF